MKGKRAIKAVQEIFAVFFLLIFFATGALVWEGWRAYHFTSEHPSVVFIPVGTPLQRTGHLLAAQDVISSPFYFQWIVRLFFGERSLQAGEYHIPAGFSMTETIRYLQEGQTIAYKVTIPEGLMSLEIVALLSKETRLKGDIADALPEEGTLLPETYHYHRGQTRLSLLERMGTAHQDLLKTLWPHRQEGLPFQTPREAVVLASLVEREAEVAAERRKIAGVFINRLKLGMPLQSDPTVRYALYKKEGRPFEGPLYRTHLKIDSPYNTYVVSGLPPHAICHPGKASLEAVLNPEKTQDLYFVADGTGAHLFSQTYKEHQRHHAAWRRLRRRCGPVRPKTTPLPSSSGIQEAPRPCP